MKGLHTTLVSKAHGRHHIVDETHRLPSGKKIRRVVAYIQEIAANKYKSWMWDSANQTATYPSLHHAHHDLDEQYVARLVIQRLNQ